MYNIFVILSRLKSEFMQESPLKNLKIAKILGVSHPTIGRWINEAYEKKNNLQIVESKNRFYKPQANKF